eukprot:Gb_10929 [translate_table: standard]
MDHFAYIGPSLMTCNQVQEVPASSFFSFPSIQCRHILPGKEDIAYSMDACWGWKDDSGNCWKGERKSINSELWHACAGPLVSLPPVGSLVYYFPQGHSEQISSTYGDTLGSCLCFLTTNMEAMELMLTKDVCQLSYSAVNLSKIELINPVIGAKRALNAVIRQNHLCTLGNELLPRNMCLENWWSQRADDWGQKVNASKIDLVSDLEKNCFRMDTNHIAQCAIQTVGWGCCDEAKGWYYRYFTSISVWICRDCSVGWQEVKPPIIYSQGCP